MPENPATIGPYRCGRGQPLLVIAGPCVIESEALTLRIAAALAAIHKDLALPLVFKASFDKANRTSVESYRGSGACRGAGDSGPRQRGNRVAGDDGHPPARAGGAGRRRLRLLADPRLSRAADRSAGGRGRGRAGRYTSKKGQFLAPADMRHVVGKLEAAGCRQILLGERGTFFGYGRLVNDMRSIPADAGPGPAGHFRRHPQRAGAGRPGGRDRGQPGHGRAAGPSRRGGRGATACSSRPIPIPMPRPSDGPNMVPLDRFAAMLGRLLRLRRAVEELK